MTRKEKRNHYKNNWKLTMRKLNAQMSVEYRQMKNESDNQVKLEEEIKSLNI